MDKTTRMTPCGLAVHHWLDKATPAESLPLVLLHGWGMDSDCWLPLLPALCAVGPVMAIDLPGSGSSRPSPDLAEENLLARLEAVLPAPCLLAGWSLGGMLAVALAQRAPHKVQRLVTLAANPCFVAREGWPAAMTPEVNAVFNQSFARHPLATHKRFIGLIAQGDVQERTLLKRLRQQSPAPMDVATAARALQLLTSMDNRVSFAGLRQPGLHLMAEKDALVPVAAASSMAALNPVQQVEVLPGISHGLLLSAPEQVGGRMLAFFSGDGTFCNKQRIASSFSRAAASYDEVAGLQREVADRLLGLLPQAQVTRMLDLGCGTGYGLAALQQRYPAACLLAADLAQGMLHYARRHRPVQAQWLAADAEQLPLAEKTIDLIFSSLALQWCARPERLFASLRRVLTDGGRLAFSTLGPATLHELRGAWAEVDAYVHVNAFIPADQLRRALQQAGLEVESWSTRTRVLHYPSVKSLSHALKALGAHNNNAGQPKGLTGRRKLRQLEAAYEPYRQQGMLPATYEVFYIQARAV